MKKLPLLLLLSLSFSVHAQSLTMVAPCESGDFKKEVEEAKNTFKKYKWPTIDVTRKSVEETAASVIKLSLIHI